MQAETMWFTGHDGKQLFMRHWFNPQREPKAIVHISHGMAEHSLRYQELAEKFTQLDCVVFANDHRGHGETGKQNQIGHYADNDGWETIIDDIDKAIDYEMQRYPHLPVFLLGHSMGNAIAQGYAIQHGKRLSGLMLSAPNFGMPLFFFATQLIARVEALRIGKSTPSKLINFLSFSSFNKAFKPNRTEYDWLTRDNRHVDLYIADPLCGFMCTPQLWFDFLGALNQIFQEKNQQKIPKNLPIYLLGGDRDPVGDDGRAILSLVKRFQQIGIKDVSYHLYHLGRHEMFNETNREEVYSDLMDWLQQHIRKK